MMTAQENAFVEWKAKEAERKGYQRALRDLANYLNDCAESVNRRIDEGCHNRQFCWGVVEGLDRARAWAYNKTDI